MQAVVGLGCHWVPIWSPAQKRELAATLLILTGVVGQAEVGKGALNLIQQLAQGLDWVTDLGLKLQKRKKKHKLIKMNFIIIY